MHELWLSFTSQCMEQRESKVKLIYNAIDKMMNILSYVDFSKLCHVIKYLPQSNQIFGKEDINSPISKVQEPLNGDLF